MKRLFNSIYSKFSLLFLLCIICAKASSGQQLAIHGEVNYTGLNVAAYYQHQLKSVLLETGIQFNGSDRTHLSPSVMYHIGAYAQVNKETVHQSYVGPRTTFGQLSPEISVQLITLQYWVNWNLHPNIAVQAGTSYGLAIERGPISNFSYLSGSIHLGCGYKF